MIMNLRICIDFLKRNYISDFVCKCLFVCLKIDLTILIVLIFIFKYFYIYYFEY